jgi:riboflavin synthase alpha subunit
VFTGIVEHQAEIVRLTRGELCEVELDAGPAAQGVAIGDSVALDGCCLTVTRVLGSRLVFQAVPETLRKSALGDRQVGDRVNVERSLRADARLGGHFVQGHVDGTGVVREVTRRGEDVLLRVDCSPDVARYLVSKGSIAVDGVSLTVVDPDSRGFSVALIPHTLKATTLGSRRPGDRVNLEGDVLGKYVLSYLANLGIDAAVRRG